MAAQDQHDDDQEHLGGPTPGVDRGAGTTSARGDTDGPTSTGATTTGQGSTGTGNPRPNPTEEAPAGGAPVPATDRAAQDPGAVGDAPTPGDPEVSDADGDSPATPIDPS